MWLDDYNNCQIKGPWSRLKIIEHLEGAIIPIRLSVISPGGWPLIASLWFFMDTEGIWSATPKSSKVAKILFNTPKCGFEIASDNPPYFGIRGQAIAKISPGKAEEVLLSVLDKYNQQNSSLAKWLLSRVDEEVAVHLKPIRIQSWDYTERMQT